MGESHRLVTSPIDGQLTPGAGGEQIGFVLQSRGVSDVVGALISGSVRLRDGHVMAQLKEFVFGQDVRRLLPREMREWWERHELAGNVDVPHFDYTPATDGKPAKFTVQTVLNDVGLAVPPEEWMTTAEVRRRGDAREAVEMMREAFRVAGGGEGSGFRVQGSPGEGFRVQGSEPIGTIQVSLEGQFPPQPAPLSALTPDPRTLIPDLAPTPFDGLADLLASRPIQLKHVAGTLVFTETGIAVKDITGRLENNAFKIAGQIDGYRPDAGLALRIASLDTEDLNIPSAPRYIWSLPRDVRDFVSRPSAAGTVRMGMDLSRQEGGAAVRCNGVVEIIDGQFLVKDFPYPLREVTGQVRLRHDPSTGLDW